MPRHASAWGYHLVASEGMKCASRMQGYIFLPFLLFLSLVFTFFLFFPSFDLEGELCLYGKCVHWKNYDNTTHILRLLVVLVVILILITFLMHLSNLFMQNMLCGTWKIFKKFCVEVRLASMMRAPLPRALHLALWHHIRLSAPRAFKH